MFTEVLAIASAIHTPQVLLGNLKSFDISLGNLHSKIKVGWTYSDYLS